MSGFLSRADGRVVALIDQRYAALRRTQDDVIDRFRKKSQAVGDGPEAVFARVLENIPESLTTLELQAWLAAAMTRLIVEGKPRDSEESSA